MIAVAGVALLLSGWLPPSCGADAVHGAPLDAALASAYDVAVKSGIFRCLDHSGPKLSISQVNDDFCDCADGSDEPGSPACAGTGVSFTCLNHGSWSAEVDLSQTLPTSRVRDDICDCCDGSDEADPHGAGGPCPNTCEQEVRSLLEERRQLRAAANAGWEAREGLVEKAKEYAAGSAERIRDREEAIARAEEDVKEAKAALAREIAAEEEEKQKLSAEDRNSGFEEALEALGIADASVGTVLERIIEVAETTGATTELEVLLEEAGVELPDPPRGSGDTIEQLSADDRVEALLKVEDLPTLQRMLVDLMLQADVVDDALAVLLRDEDARKKAAEVVNNLSIGDVEAHVRKEAEDARSLLKKLERELQKVKRDLDKARDDEKKIEDQDYGPDNVLLTLREACVAKNVSQYTYEVCLFNEVRQKDSRSSRSYRLGRFDSLQYGDGAEKDTLKSIVYKNGDRCPGKAREAIVDLSCGAENLITSVDEPETCVYHFSLLTPAVCGPPDTSSFPHDGEEL